MQLFLSFQTHSGWPFWGDWVVDQSPRFLLIRFNASKIKIFSIRKIEKLAQKQKSRRRALKRSTIDFRGTHVVCIGVPLKSRQNAIFLTSYGHSWIRSPLHYPTQKEIIPEGDQSWDSWKTRTDTGHRASMNRKSAQNLVKNKNRVEGL